MTSNPTRLRRMRLEGGWRPQGLLDGASLLAAVRLTAEMFVPVAFYTAGLFAAAYLLFPYGDERWRLYKYASDHQMVVEQFDRAATVAMPDIAFVGDSSCLMGIDVPLLRGVFAAASIESFCTVAYAGPVSYGRIVRTLMDRGATPKYLILSLHPQQFSETPRPAWVSFPDLTPSQSSEGVSPITVLDYLRIRWLGLILHQPLDQSYGLYYGSDAAFRALIRRSHGSAIDPYSGLDARSLDEIDRMEKYKSPPGRLQSYSTSVGFLDALDAFGRAVAQFDRRRLFVLITPVPDSFFPPNGTEAQRGAALTIAAHLGIPEDQILSLPSHLPARYFSTDAHLNRWGRIVFSRLLATELRALP